ncbi:efflux RND transporter periplasmic adaptor subunit, partial [Candidatus Parcubacteria bacterium]|nr:efflux RND transporter periplasmic adaptor subunit [Candidatus Parcubacteria bacterium]
MEKEIKIVKKKRFYKKKLFYILLVVGLILVSVVYGKIKKANQPPTYETVQVERGVLSQTVDAAGNIESANELDLKFDTGGRLGKIYKQTNEEVKVGDVIAELELGELNGRVAQASASANRAKANLDKVLAGQTDSYILNFKAKLDQAEANLNQIKATSADTVANAEAALNTAKSNLELSEGGEDSQIVQNAYDDTLTLLLSIQTTLAGALNEADNILGVDNTFANDEYESVLSTLDPSKFNVAKSSYNQTKNAKQSFDLVANSIGLYSLREEINSAADKAQTALIAAKDLLYKVTSMLDSTIPVGDLSQAELTALKTGIATDRGLVNADYTSLVNQIQAIETAKSSYSTYSIAYNKALSNLENAKSKAEADINVYQALV